MRKFQSALQGLQEMIEGDSVFSNSLFWLCLAILGLYDFIRKFLKNAKCSLLYLYIYILYNHSISTPSLILLTLYSPKILLESVMKDLDIRILYVFQRFSSTFPPPLSISQPTTCSRPIRGGDLQHKASSVITPCDDSCHGCFTKASKKGKHG